MSKIKVVLAEGAVLPTKGTVGAAGFDLYSPVDGFILGSELRGKSAVQVGKAIIDTGVIFEIPEGMVGYIKCRSGLGFKHDITALEGTIDSDFRDTVKVKLFNLGLHDYRFAKGERIAQIVFQKVEDVELTEAKEEALSTTARGKGGLGHTGK